MANNVFRSATNAIFYLFTAILIGFILMTGIAIFLSEFDLKFLILLIMLLILEIEILNFRKIALNLSSEEPISETVVKAFDIISDCLLYQAIIWLIFNSAVDGGLVLNISFPSISFPGTYFGIEPFVILYFSLFFSAMSSFFDKIATSNSVHISDSNELT